MQPKTGFTSVPSSCRLLPSQKVENRAPPKDQTAREAMRLFSRFVFSAPFWFSWDSSHAISYLAMRLIISARAEVRHVIATKFQPGQKGWNFSPSWNSPCNQALNETENMFPVFLSANWNTCKVWENILMIMTRTMIMTMTMTMAMTMIVIMIMIMIIGFQNFATAWNTILCSGVLYLKFGQSSDKWNNFHLNYRIRKPI